MNYNYSGHNNSVKSFINIYRNFQKIFIIYTNINNLLFITLSLNDSSSKKSLFVLESFFLHQGNPVQLIPYHYPPLS